jgi:hypothetical protein
MRGIEEGREVAECGADSAKEAVEVFDLGHAVSVVAPALPGPMAIESAIEGELRPAAVDEVAYGVVEEGVASLRQGDDVLTSIEDVAFATNELKFFQRCEHAAHGRAADAELAAKIALAHVDVKAAWPVGQGVEQVEARGGEAELCQ